MKIVAWFKEIKREDVPTVGGKGASLGEMYNAKLPIPVGFFVTAQAFGRFLKEAKLGKKIFPLLNKLDVQDTAKLEQTAKHIQELILDQEVPEDIAIEIKKAYENMNVSLEVTKISKVALDMIKAGRDIPWVAVRSSATAEDLPTASFAGQQATFLNIKGKDNVVRAVQRCWASLYTARAIYYRVKNNFPHDKVLISVVVQKMIDSESSGVTFSVNPTTNNHDEIVIEAGFGLGDAIVGGQITPDYYVVDKNNFKIKQKKVNKQKWMYMRDDHLRRTIKKVLSEEKSQEQKLTDAQIVKLAELTKKIEKLYNGKPQDVEFAVEHGRVYIVQSRPVTTVQKVEKAKAHEEIKLEPVLTGLGASPGIGKGIVKLVHGVSDLTKIQKGDILVTVMTNPDYVVAMQKASAIITDEGGMTCFAGNTKVLTNKGFLNIEEVDRLHNEGESLVVFSCDYKTRKPKWKKIINTNRRKSKLIRVSTSQTNRMDHNILDVTEDHKFYTFNNRNLIKKPISNIFEDNEMVCLIDKLPKIPNEVDDPKLSYLMGALLSDGHIKVINHHTGNPRRGNVTFTQKQTEQKLEFINTVKSYFNEIFNYEFNLEREKNTVGCIRGRQIIGSATDFICMRLQPALELTKITNNLANWTLLLNENSCLNLLAGLIDGDGCFYDNRFHIYVNKEHILQSVILACLKLGIVPQISVNRTIHHVQILERMDDIMMFTKRVKGQIKERSFGTKLYSAKQILENVIEEVNWKGKIKPYVKNNLLIDHNKIIDRVLPLAKIGLKKELINLLNSNLRMHRIKKLNDLGVDYVYNIEVDSNEELDKNYIIFTSKYTPLLVSNCHSAIVGREMGIPVVVGTMEATKTFKEGEKITVDGTNGKIYRGEAQIQDKKEIKKDYEFKETKTHIYMNLGVPDEIDEYKDLHFDGIGLMRLEFVIASEIKEHPLYLIKNNQQEKYVNGIYENIKKVASVISPKPLIVRFSDFKSNEYRNLKGGDEFEPHEDNPMIGFRGVSRYISEEFKPAFKLECEAIKKIREELKNVHVMLPFVRNVDEVKKVLEIMKECGLEKSEEFEIYLMAEVPSFSLLARDFSKLNITGCSIGSNDLTQLILGVDRDSALLGKMGYFDEKNDAVKLAIKRMIRSFHEAGKKVSLCGQAGSDKEYAKFLVGSKIDSISVNPDMVNEIRHIVSEIEKETS